jgi:hypothetical protein
MTTKVKSQVLARNPSTQGQGIFWTKLLRNWSRRYIYARATPTIQRRPVQTGHNICRVSNTTQVRNVRFCRTVRCHDTVAFRHAVPYIMVRYRTILHSKVPYCTRQFQNDPCARDVLVGISVQYGTVRFTYNMYTILTTQ